MNRENVLFFILDVLSPDPYRQPRPLRPDEILGVAFFPFGVSLGMAAAWRWQRVGGLITAGSLVAFYTSRLILREGIPGGPRFILFSLPGLLFPYLRFPNLRLCSPYVSSMSAKAIRASSLCRTARPC